MSKPVWDVTQPSNSSLGTFLERKTLGLDGVPLISLKVKDTDDLSEQTFTSTIYKAWTAFSSNVEKYATLNEVFIKSNGVPTTQWLNSTIIDGGDSANTINVDGGGSLITGNYVIADGGGTFESYIQYDPLPQSYVFKFPALRPPLSRPKKSIAALGDIGVAINGVPFRSPNSGKTTTFNGTKYTENKVMYPDPYSFTDGSGIIESDNKFFYHFDPSLLYTKDPLHHSPIIGYAFDGLPIYGPYGYNNPLDANSGIRIITSSYQLKTTRRANGNLSDGSYIEDYEYVGGSGDLDQYNTRFCKTPEYPSGIQAYFVTIDPNNPTFPVYPYIVGPSYWGTPITDNGNFNWPKKIDFALITGKLPGGLRLEGSNIVGTPFAVVGSSTFRFVLRATNLEGITDRTFTIKITSENQSIIWGTQPGSLPVGNNHHYYVLDNSLIDFQLDAFDNDLPNGKYLNYYIPPNGGELPGGITLSRTGRLYGFTAPILAVETGGNLGKYDTTLYDRYGYDYGVRPINGYDSFYYDNQTYDYSIPNRAPKKLNRYYRFKVRASDGVRYVDREFKIYVVGDDYLRADNEILCVGTNTFSADNTYMRKAIWITPKYIGRLRANNYLTIILDVFDPATLEGKIGYILAATNDDGSPSVLPPGMVLDQLTGEVYGSVPYQPAITKTYKFTINALRYSYDQSVPNVPSLRTFTVDLIGNIDSVINFTTSGDLGSIDANFISNLSVTAVTTVQNAILTYSLKSGKLPPGLRLLNDGTIQGKVNQFSTADSFGLITFDNNTMTLDGHTTTIDRSYTFTVEARDQFNESATTKTFNLDINTPNNKLYSNLYVKPFLKSDMRSKLTEFFSDTGIFEPKSMYRSSDLEFGIQNELKMLLYPGIETKNLSAYIYAFSRSSKKKFRIGNLKKAIAKTPGTNDVVYELVYLEIVDNLENNNVSISEYINTAFLNHPITVDQSTRDIIDRDKFDNNINVMTLDALSNIKIQDRVITVDYDGQLVSDKNKSNVFGNSIKNLQKKIANIGDSERNYLPLWMRTPQTFSGVEQGFTKAIPLCYCVPGTADNIILNIKHSGFDFKMINYTVDRAIIDNVVGEAGDKYIAFPAREVING